ncbi:Na+/H+ antiporter [Marinilactibacillus psychrotolerans 42ea]|uniref:Na+/H+ antiporter n=1 Tax=Marinilactibacillus psychrotolerans 42ea TaxID=1255609 RepID=A0A1R4IUI3_9LACT|nr:sodium:proton antiporter [Marinilactibacillus psychrotolerans]SJN23537.1 Na+/H+ antiporter [Marinilactibacillus psychrotolerans 42ea]
MTILHQLLILLLVSIIVRMLDIKQKYFPVLVVLALIGIGLSFIPIFSDFSVASDVLYEVFIPGLLFVSAYQFSAKAFKSNAPVIITLATIGMLSTVFLLGIGIYYIAALIHPLAWNVSLLLAAILVPTDPVSVVNILKKSNGVDEIADIVEGESMLNDGTSIVMFTIVLSMVETNGGFSILHFLQEFLFVSAGGVGVGLITGWILSKLLRFTSHPDYLVMLSVLTAYGSFLLAEQFGFSGVLATVVSGIMLSFAFAKKETEIEKETRNHLNIFWNIINPILTSILFLFIGIQATSYLNFNQWPLAFMVFLLSVLARTIIVFSLMSIFPNWRKTLFRNKLLNFSLLSWAGIKGSMSIVLLLWTVNSSVGNQSLVISIAFAAILISFVLQSMGVYPLTKLLKKVESK